MNAKVQDIASAPDNVLKRNTGFPEPLSRQRNTTLPHPDADRSKNAAIEAPDIALSHTQSRRALLGRRSYSKHNVNKGSLSAAEIAMYEIHNQDLDERKDGNGVKPIEKMVVEGNSNVLQAPAQDGDSSVGNANPNGNGDVGKKRQRDGKGGMLRKMSWHNKARGQRSEGRLI